MIRSCYPKYAKAWDKRDYSHLLHSTLATLTLDTRALTTLDTRAKLTLNTSYEHLFTHSTHEHLFTRSTHEHLFTRSTHEHLFTRSTHEHLSLYTLDTRASLYTLDRRTSQSIHARQLCATKFVTILYVKARDYEYYINLNTKEIKQEISIVK